MDKHHQYFLSVSEKCQGRFNSGILFYNFVVQWQSPLQRERERERKIKESNFLSPFTYLLFLILARVCPIEMYFPLIYVNVTLATDGMITYWKEMHPHSATSPPLWVLSETIIGLSLGAVF